MGETIREALKLQFDRRLKLGFHVGCFDRCCATGIDFTPEVMKPEKPHRRLKWEIPLR